MLKTLKDNKIYLQIPECNFGSDVIGRLTYRASSEGMKRSREKIKPLEVWREELQNDTRAGPLVELTGKRVDFKWTAEHPKAVKALKGKLGGATSASSCKTIRA